ncbi:hypothetical protein D3C75_778220 [compost metagenome]
MRTIPLQHFQRLRTVSHRHRHHAGVVRHLQIERRVTHHQRLLGRQRAMFENLAQHARVWLARRLIGTARDIEEIFPAVPGQHPIQAAPALAGSHRQAVALFAKHQQRLAHPLEQRRGRAFQLDVMITVDLPEARHLLRILQPGIERADRLRQTEADDAANSHLAQLRQRALARRHTHRLDDPGNRIDQGPIPVEHQQLTIRHPDAPGFSPTRRRPAPPARARRHRAASRARHGHAETGACRPARESRG